jgi:hypothetical protein
LVNFLSRKFNSSDQYPVKRVVSENYVPEN